MKIIDASVALKWFLAEDDSDRSDLILEELKQKPNEFAVPELFYFEIEAVLLRKVEQELVSKSMGYLLRLGIHRHAMDESLASTVAEFSKRFRLTGYDAAYAALAKLLEGSWLTFDQEAAERLKGQSFCKYLGN